MQRETTQLVFMAAVRRVDGSETTDDVEILKQIQPTRLIRDTDPVKPSMPAYAGSCGSVFRAYQYNSENSKPTLQLLFKPKHGNLN